MAEDGGRSGATGVQQFTILYTCPSERPNMIQSNCLLPSIVMLLQANDDAMRDTPDMMAADFDVHKQTSTLLTWVEANVYFVMIVNGNYAQKAHAVLPFVAKLINTLRTFSLIQSMRS